MLDIKRIRQDREAIEKKLQAKVPGADLSHVVALDEGMRALKQEVEGLKAQRNELSKQVGELKRAGKDAASTLAKAAQMGDRIATLDGELRQLEEQLEAELATLPNPPMDHVPEALSPTDNVCLKEWGEKPNFSFSSKNHLELNEQLALFDFQRGAKLSGAGWPVYQGMGARLEWALLHYMMDHHVKKGYTPLMLPLCVHKEVMYGSGQLPKFAHQTYKLTDEDYTLYLIPTSEVPINGLHREEILNEEELPKRYVAYTPCFRREAGAAGKAERGLIRTHQFNKVEMFCLTKPEKSTTMFDEMVASAEELVQGLGLHYRLMLLVTADTSFAAACTVDLEVWLPGQDRYYEISSISNCTDFQARRSRIRFRPTGGKAELVHTLNGSGLATSRLMVALLENNQREDGSVVVPPVLRPYLDGAEML